MRNFLTLILLFCVGCATSSKSSDLIDSAIKQHKDDFRYCYEHEYSLDNEINSGTVVLSWTIEQNGSASNVQVFSSTLKNKHVEQCLVTQTEKIRFPAKNDAMKVKYPFAFARR
jgi:hypothetical protein